MHKAIKIGLIAVAVFGALFVLGVATYVPNAQGTVTMVTNPDGTKHYYVDIQETITAEETIN